MIKGQWNDKGSALQIGAILRVQGNCFTLKIANHTEKTGRLNDVRISDRLGNVDRKLTFDDNSVFSTSNNDAVDQFFKPYLGSNRFLHIIESNLPFVILALVLTVAATFSFFKWGVPAVSTAVAYALPQEVNHAIGVHTLEFLDDVIFDKSRLDENRKEQIRQHFEKKLVAVEGDTKKFALHFRAWNISENGIDRKEIPNALALPSGDIILTDKFVELSQNQAEIDAVLLHEMGHVVHRHSLEMIVQSSLVTVVVMVALGDVNGIADLGLGLGSLLLSANYSRGHELEADKYAFDHMLQLGIDPISFTNIIRRLEEYSIELSMDKEVNKAARESDVVPNNEEETKTNALDYFSTHPDSEHRAQLAEHYSQCFKQGLTSCELNN